MRSAVRMGLGAWPPGRLHCVQWPKKEVGRPALRTAFRILERWGQGPHRSSSLEVVRVPARPRRVGLSPHDPFRD